MLERLLVLLLFAACCSLALAQEKPVVPQRNLVTFFDKCRAGTPVTVAYIGGSVTSGEYPKYVTEWLGQQFKGLKINHVNAAVGGTGSYLGVYRLDKHVLQYNPDLLVVEFAINDRATDDVTTRATMEGIVRQCWRRDKKPDILFFFITHGDLQCPMTRHQAVADAYGIPTVDVQKVVHTVVDPGFIDWKIIAPDNVHPNSWGHAIYAATICTFLKHQMELKEAVPPPAQLPPPAFSDLYETARMIPVTDFAPEGWEKIPAAGNFREGSLRGTKAGQTAEFKFTGKSIGLYYVHRQNGGVVAFEVDGKRMREGDFSWGPTYKWDRENLMPIASGLAPGEHTLKIIITDKRPPLSEGNEFQFGYLMVAG